MDEFVSSAIEVPFFRGRVLHVEFHSYAWHDAFGVIGWELVAGHRTGWSAKPLFCVGGCGLLCGGLGLGFLWSVSDCQTDLDTQLGDAQWRDMFSLALGLELDLRRCGVDWLVVFFPSHRCQLDRRIRHELDHGGLDAASHRAAFRFCNPSLGTRGISGFFQRLLGFTDFLADSLVVVSSKDFCANLSL